MSLPRSGKPQARAGNKKARSHSHAHRASREDVRVNRRRSPCMPRRASHGVRSIGSTQAWISSSDTSARKARAGHGGYRRGTFERSLTAFRQSRRLPGGRRPARELEGREPAECGGALLEQTVDERPMASAGTVDAKARCSEWVRDRSGVHVVYESGGSGNVCDVRMLPSAASSRNERRAIAAHATCAFATVILRVARRFRARTGGMPARRMRDARCRPRARRVADRCAA